MKLNLGHYDENKWEVVGDKIIQRLKRSIIFILLLLDIVCYFVHIKIFDDSKIDQMLKASETLSTSRTVPVRNDETADTKLDQEGKNRAWVIW